MAPGEGARERLLPWQLLRVQRAGPFL